MLTLLDVILLIMLTLAAWGGWRAGATTLLLSLVGLALGVVGGLLLAGHLLSPRLATLTHLGLALLCALGAALVGRSIGSRLGRGAAATMRRLHLRVVDGVVGSVLRVGVTGVVIWLAAAVLASLTATGLPRVVDDSVIVTGLNRTLPPVGTLTATIQRDGAGLIPADVSALLPQVNPPSAGVAGTGVDVSAGAQGRSVVKVLTTGCGTGSEGSGFVTAEAGTSYVITNAHVVAGADRVTVSSTRGPTTAQVVVFDAAADLAVLRAPGLGAPALQLTAATVANGSTATILGYPRDGALTQTTAVITQRLPTVASAGSGLSVREVYRLRAHVEHGNSGSPLITADGRVAGVVNALSLTERDTGFALTSTAVEAELARAAATTTAPADVGPGTCTS